jgi:hypothetical protein
LVTDGAGVRRTARAQGFSQHHRHATVQQTKGLVGSGIDRNPTHDKVITDFYELDTQMR